MATGEVPTSDWETSESARKLPPLLGRKKYVVTLLIDGLCTLFLNESSSRAMVGLLDEKDHKTQLIVDGMEIGLEWKETVSLNVRRNDGTAQKIRRVIDGSDRNFLHLLDIEQELFQKPLSPDLSKLKAKLVLQEGDFYAAETTSNVPFAKKGIQAVTVFTKHLMADVIGVDIEVEFDDVIEFDFSGGTKLSFPIRKPTTWIQLRHICEGKIDDFEAVYSILPSIPDADRIIYKFERQKQAGPVLCWAPYFGLTTEF